MASAPGRKLATDTIEETIYKYFRQVNDAHTHIVGHRSREMVQSLRPFFASIVIEKEREKYIVVDTKDPHVRKGDVYTDSVKYLFRTLSKTGTLQYLIGKQSVEPVTQLRLQFTSGIKDLELHPSKIGDLRFDERPDIFEMDTTSRIPYIRTSSFATARGEQTLTQFMLSGTALKNKPAFIWNLIDTHGGDGFYPAGFIKNFNGTSWEDATVLTLYSPVINQCYWEGRNSWIRWDSKSMKGLHDDHYPLDSIPVSKREKIRKIRLDKETIRTYPVKYWEVEMPPQKEQGHYKGKAILLVNHRTNSAANNAVACTKSIPNSIIIGENTGSVYTFANVKYYALQHSRIKLWLPSVLILNPDNHMEKGFAPDYWLDSAQPTEEVRNWLSSPDNYQFHY